MIWIKLSLLTWSLTTSIDNITGTSGNDTFNAVFSAAGTVTGADGTSFNTADIVNGGSGTDTVSYIVMGDAAGKGATNTVVPANLTNIEQFVVRNLATDLGTNPTGEEVHTLDLAGVSGVTNVTNKSSTAGVIFNNIGKTASVTVDGVITGNTTFTRGATAITDALTINITNGVKAGDIKSNDTNNDATSVTINSSGAKNVVGAVEVTGDGGANHTATSVTINATTDLTIGTANGTADLTGFDTAKDGTITVTGAGKVVLNDLAGVVKTLNAGSNTGGVTAIALAGNLQEVTGGSGKDSITLADALNDKGFVKLGAGNDTLNIGANAINKGATVELGDGDDALTGTGAINKDAVIDAGAGSDTLAASLFNLVNAGAFKNFENLDLVGLGNNTLDADLFVANNTLGKLVLSGSSGNLNAAVSNVAAGIGLEITASDTNGVVINQKGTNATSEAVDKFTVTFQAPAADPVAAKTVTAASVTLNKINEVTIVSDGGEKVSNVLTTIVSDEMKTLKITGDNALTLTNLYSAGTTATNVLTTIDASGQTAGGLTMDLAAVNGALTVKLGAGDDVIKASFGVSTGGTAETTISTLAALDKISGFDKATDAEVTAGKGYDLINLIDNDGTAVNFAVAANAAGSTTAVKVANGVIDFSVLASGPQTLAAAVTQINTDISTSGNAVVFQYGANSYMFVQNEDADVIIELTGVTGVTKLVEQGTDNFYIM